MIPGVRPATGRIDPSDRACDRHIKTRCRAFRGGKEGDIDLRGFLGVRKDVPAGYPELRYTVHIKGDGTPEQMQQIHELVMATSPNRYNIARPIPLVAKLVVE